jgi:hypothetical protein
LHSSSIAFGAAAKLSPPRSSSPSYDRHETHEPTSYLPQLQQQSTPVYQQIPQGSADRLSTTSSRHRALRRTPNFEATPSPEPRRVHIAAASLGFTPRALSFDQPPADRVPLAELEPALPIRPRQESNRRRVLSQELSEDLGEQSSENRSFRHRSLSIAAHSEPHRAVQISKRTHSAILYALEEALRYPHTFTSDDVEESAAMADLVTSNGHGLPSPRRPTAAPVPTGSPSGIRSPRIIMQERAAREARQKEERLERERIEHERAAVDAHQKAEAEQMERARIEEERLRAEQEIRQARRQQQQQQQQQAAGAAANHGGGGTNPKPHDSGRHGRVPSTHQVPQQPGANPQPSSQDYTNNAGHQRQSSRSRPSEQQPQAANDAKPRNSFPHAFERWETLSAHWEGLTSYWIRKLEQNSNDINRDPVSQQLARQVTDLSAAGANLFHAVVELQRLRASSERKFQRWFFETRSELERAQEVNARLEAALEKERRERADSIRDAVERERGASKAQLQLAEMRRELAISKEEARRAWEELGRREQEERDRLFSLQSGQPAILGGVQVVPMTQEVPGRQGGSSREQAGYQPEYEPSYASASSQPQAPPAQAATTDGSYYRPQEPSQPQPSGRGAGGSEGGYSEEEYETPGTAGPQSAGEAGPSTSAPSAQFTQWTGTYSNPQDYSGAGYAPAGWEPAPRHHHPTRLSDVIEEEDERSRTSASQVSRA